MPKATLTYDLEEPREQLQLEMALAASRWKLCVEEIYSEICDMANHTQETEPNTLSTLRDKAWSHIEKLELQDIIWSDI